MRSETAVPVKLSEYTPTPYAIKTVDLDFNLAPDNTIVVARSAIEPREGTSAGTPLVLNGDELTFVSASVNGEALGEEAYAIGETTFTLKTPPAEPFTLEITTKLSPQANTKLMGLYRSSGNYCTQCEAEGFRRITYFYDRPDVLAVYTTRIEANKLDCPVLLGNGNPVESGDVEGTDNHYAVWHDPHPKPAYLFALVAGNLGSISEKYTTASGKPVDLNIYVEHGNEDRADWAMDSLIRSMRWDEKVFGREYDLDVFNIVAVSDFNMGAMENKGLNIFNDKYILADPDTATDADYEGIETVVAHEYFHNWTGNRITCRDWFQLCLKEGLTVFRDHEFSSDERSRPVKRIADVRVLKSHQFPEDAGPLAHPVRPDVYKEISNFYTATVYEKGSELVSMIKTILGEDGFRKGMDLYFDRHDGDAATIEDFIKSFEDATGEDLSQFALWYSQSGTPELTVATHYDDAAQTFTMEVSQKTRPTPNQDSKKPFVIPVRFGLVGSDGSDLAYAKVEGAEVRGNVLLIKEDAQTIVFHGVSEKPVASLLREFSAPVTLKSDVTLDEQLFLMGSDSDPFNRWQAAQTVATHMLIQMSEGSEPEGTSRFIAAIGKIAEDDALDMAFRALCLQLPTEGDIARELGSNVDPEAIYKARRTLRQKIAETLFDRFQSLYARVEPAKPFSPDAASAGARALRNSLLGYLAASGKADGAQIARDHFESADNMSDRIAALNCLVHERIDGYQQALVAFCDRHQKTPLAIDKWFVVQATDTSSDTLERVKELTNHPAFSWSNPNRVRSLVGAFVAGNQRCFNAADGSGYNYLSEITLKIDRANPQLAARMLNAFRSWRALEPTRRALAEEALRKISAAEQPLSPDVSDITERCLQ
ncbi:aminopeptidase N [Rhodobacteraceae bacterium RKSG542]|uniref:aminopeptidase N n=1 Tax=Pseudovibrio flavus TaxID=2529854 RepID=UPI0012BD6645|nr:aminopeptidase N [Pseudovibrio flavus]MTI17035.1 aminopeptidase N [Pseudovibrio flavus]